MRVTVFAVMPALFSELIAKCPDAALSFITGGNKRVERRGTPRPVAIFPGCRSLTAIGHDGQRLEGRRTERWPTTTGMHYFTIPN
jgi:hypothetical protein